MVTLSDSEARERISGSEEGLAVNLLIEAGAGTGKTRHLTQRVSRLLEMGSQEEVSSIVAITFTEKAAEEMIDRLRHNLEKRAQMGDIVRVLPILQNWEKLSISTIHSFCLSLIKDYFPELGISPEANLVDTDELREWVKETLFQILQEDKQEIKMLWSLFVNYGGKPQLLVELFTDCIWQYWDLVDTIWSKLPHKDIKIFKESLISFSNDLFKLWEDLFQRSNTFLCKNKNDSLFKSLFDLNRTLKAMGDNDPLGFLYEFGQLKISPSKGNKSNWQNDGKNEVINTLQEIKNKVLEYSNNELLIPLLTSIWSEIKKRINEQRALLGWLTYDDMLIYALKLSKQPEILAELRERFHRLHIDEFQDIDPIQTEIALLISGLKEPDNTPQSHSILSQRDGCFFAVGDPWQSIYLFRGAQIKIFQEVRERLNLLGEVHHLTLNFRSAPSILSFINQFFSFLLNHFHLNMESYVPLSPSPDRLESDPSPGVAIIDYVDLPSEERPANAQSYRRWEAKAIAGAIIQIMEERWKITERSDQGMKVRPVQFGDIVILFRTTTQIATYQRELSRLNIPFQVEGGKKMMRSPLLDEVILLLKALDQPWNRFAVVGALRSSFFRIPDSEIYESFKSDSPGMTSSVKEALDMLDDLRSRLPYLKTHQMLRQIFELSKVPFLYTLQSQRTSQEIHLVERLFHIAYTLHERGSLGLKDLISQLEILREVGDDPDDPPTEERTDRVKLSTIHSAKGLEFPIVILGDLIAQNKPFKRQAMFVDRLQNRLEVKLGESPLWISSGYDNLKQLKNKEQIDELFRILYVAMTRARDHLVIPLIDSNIQPEQNQNKLFWHAVSEFLKAHPAPNHLYRKILLPINFTAISSQKTSHYDTEHLNTLLQHDYENWIKEKESFLVNTKVKTKKIFFPSKFDLTDEDLTITLSQLSSEEKTDTHEEVRVGKAVHRYLAEFFDGKKIDENTLSILASQMGVNLEKIRSLLKYLPQSEVADMFLNAQERWSEVPLFSSEQEHIVIGRADLILKMPEGKIVILDFKTGTSKPEKDVQQVKEYINSVKKALFGYLPVVGYVIYLQPNVVPKMIEIQT